MRRIRTDLIRANPFDPFYPWSIANFGGSLSQGPVTGY